MRRTTPLLVAVSGPDRTGTSSLVPALAGLLRRRGFAVTTVHCHGCVVCRWFPVPPRVRETGEPGRTGAGEWARRFVRPERRGPRLRRAHAFVEAGELALRIGAARLRVSVAARGRPAVVVTDRGPLDGLVEFDPPPGRGAAERFARIADRYDLTLLPEARPGAPAGSGREEARPPADRWARHRAWAGRLPRVTLLDGENPPETVAAAALERVLDSVPPSADGARRDPTRHERRAPELPSATGPERRKRVVVSLYDDADDAGHRGGSALVVEQLARRLSEHYQVTVVTAGRDARSVRRRGIRYVTLPVCRAGPRVGHLLFLALLPLVARRIPHDVWLESLTPPFSTSFLPLLSRAPVVGIDQGRTADALWRHHLPFFLVERIGLRCYRHVVARNEAEASAVRRLSPRASVHVIAHGVEQHRLDEARLGSGGSILFLGRIDTWVKGLDLLLDAYESARPQMELVLAGRGTPAEERRLLRLLAVRGPGVRWVGCADEETRRRLLQDSAFLVVPSRHETFCLVALEGMSYGKPVLHFDLPALRWIRGSGDVAVPPFDTAAFGEEMAALASDPTLRGRLGRQAGLAAQHYAWDEMTSAYLALTRRIVDGPAAPRPRRDRRVPWQSPR
ncbi:glycosyltransferase family 4 protein [Streptomyces sp. NPDC051921]|uniref:glycosyltransferase family 4 protein n=1 Tax=Streptomyces sp. NPDC051921 TaxID=3155806 RepID=UPI00343F44A0